MRATQATTFRSLGTFLDRTSERMADLQLQAATGKRLNRPSDDPSAISPVLSARTQIQQSDRYIETIDTGLDRIDNMDGNFAHIENILQRVREITISGVNGGLSQEDMSTYGDEVAQLKDELLSAANAQVDGKYLFGGYQTKTAPFVVNPAYDPLTYDPTVYDPATNPPPVLYQGDAGQMKMEIAPGERVRVGVDGGTFFLGLQDTSGDGSYDNSDSIVGSDLFHQLALLEADLKANRVAPVAETQTGDFSAVTVAAGEGLMFTMGSETITYTNSTGGVLNGAGLVADIAATLAISTATGAAGDYSFTQDGGAGSVILDITQAAGNESGIAPITMQVLPVQSSVATMATTVNGSAIVAEKQTGDFSAVSVAVGEAISFTIDSETITYTNGTGGALSGANLVADIALTLATSTATGAAGDYTFTQEGGAGSVTLGITQAAGNESDIAPTTMQVLPAFGSVATMAATVDGTAGVANRLTGFDSATEQARIQRSLLGNIGTRLETARGHMEDIKIDMEEMRARYEDADIIETITELQQQQQAFEAALNVTGQVSALSILDYLR